MESNLGISRLNSRNQRRCKMQLLPHDLGNVGNFLIICIYIIQMWTQHARPQAAHARQPGSAGYGWLAPHINYADALQGAFVRSDLIAMGPDLMHIAANTCIV